MYTSSIEEDYAELCIFFEGKMTTCNCRFQSILSGLCILQIIRRGLPPSGGGEVVFSCSVVKCTNPILFTDPGKIKKVRGLVYPNNSSLMNKFPIDSYDTYMHTPLFRYVVW